MTSLFLVLLLSVSVFAVNHLSNLPDDLQSDSAGSQVMNQILFSESSQSWTSRDFKLYKRVLSLTTASEKLTEFSDSLVEDFLLSRLLKREALLFEIEPKKLPTLSAQKDLSEFSKAEIEQEIGVIARALALLDLKSSQVSQKIRFKTWMDVLKRKYSVRLKASES